MIATFAIALSTASACHRDVDESPAPTSTREPKQETPPAAHPAVGPVDRLEPVVQATFAETPHFAPLRPPGAGDWLSSHPEPGQTVEEFRRSGPNFPSADHRTIYLLPIGEFPITAPPIATLAEYTRAFFMLEVAVLPTITPESLAATTREFDYGPQLRTDDVLDALEPLLPADAFLLVGVTMVDLYPGDDWNYVFGYASLERRVSVYSLLRFDPLVMDPRAEIATAQRQHLMLQRSLEIMSHELTHSFGALHCIHYDCLMNGTNSLDELDVHPSHLCPVCLRKLHVATGFDPVARYERLGEFYEAHGLDAEAGWIAVRLEYLGRFQTQAASASRP